MDVTGPKPLHSRRNSLRCGPVPLRRPDSREWDLRVPKRRAVCCHRLPPELGSLQPNVFVSTSDGGRNWVVESVPALAPPYRPRAPIVD